MPNKSPFDVANYCSRYKYIYPYNIAEVLNLDYITAEGYFYKYKKMHKNIICEKKNAIKSIDFFEWYFKGMGRNESFLVAD